MNLVEEITQDEYEWLTNILSYADEADKDDLTLYDTGPHRDLYNYLTRQMGLSIEPGRGPVWHRAKRLVEVYEKRMTREGYKVRW